MKLTFLKIFSENEFLAFPHCVKHSVELSGFFVVQILREINFGESGSLKNAVHSMLGVLNSVNLVKFSLQKVPKIHKNQYLFRASKRAEIADFVPLESHKLISHKIRVIENL